MEENREEQRQEAMPGGPEAAAGMETDLSLPEPLLDQPQNQPLSPALDAAPLPDAQTQPAAPAVFGEDSAPVVDSIPQSGEAVAAPRPPVPLLRLAAFLLGLLLMAGSCFLLYKMFLAPSARRELVLFFSDFRQERLRGATRTVAAPANEEALLRKIMQELCFGPVSNDTLPSIPPGTVLLGSWIHNATAYVDFSRELYMGLGSEGRAEYLAVYSIVTSVFRNMSGIRNVRILVEGGTLPTLRGLTRIDGPLVPRPDMLPVE